MAVLVHDCTDCGHRQDMHGQGGFASDPGSGRRLSFSACGCCATSAKERSPLNLDPEPRRWETFAEPGGRPEPLYEPGSIRNSGNVSRSNVCDCARCRELYDAEARS